MYVTSRNKCTYYTEITISISLPISSDRGNTSFQVHACVQIQSSQALSYTCPHAHTIVARLISPVIDFEYDSSSTMNRVTPST